MHFDKEIDVRGLYCPYPFLRSKKALTAMASGQVLHVLLTDPSSLKHFGDFAELTGNELLETAEKDKAFEVYLMRK